MSTAAKKAFIDWVRVNDPGLYRLAVKRMEIMENKGLSGFMDSIGNFFTGLVDTVKNVAPTVVQAAAQKKILDVQVKRAEQGLPPLQVEQYSPVIRVAPTVTPESEAALTRIAVETTQSGLTRMLPIIGLGLGGVLLIMMMKGRRAR